MFCTVDFGNWTQTTISLLIKKIFQGTKGMHCPEKQWIGFLTKCLENSNQINLERCLMRILCGSCFVKKTKLLNDHSSIGLT